MNPPRVFTFFTVFLFGVIVLLPIFYMVLTPLWGTPDEQLSVLTLFDSRQLTLAKNSLGLAGGAACLSMLVGVPFAFLICRTDLRGKGLFGIIYIISVLIPPNIHAIVWTHLNDLFKKIFLCDVHSLWGAIFVLTLCYYPFVTFMTLAGLKSIDRNLEEASLICHGKLHTLRRITLPLAMPHILSGAIFVFIFSIINLEVPDILRVKAYPLEIFIQFSAFYNESAATILSLPLVGVTFLLLALQKWYMKDRSYVQIAGGFQRHIVYKLRMLNWIAFVFCFMVIVLSSALPVAALLHVAGPLTTYIKVLRSSIHQIGYSLVLAFFGAMATLFLGFSLAYLIERLKSRVTIALSWTIFMPLAIPATALGIGLIGIWNGPVTDCIYGTSLILVLGYIVRFIPYAVIVITSGLKQLNPHLEEVAFLSRSYWSSTLRQIILPLSKHSLLVVLFIVFILAFGELGTTLLIIPPGRETIPIKIYNLMHYGADQMVAALCLTLIFLILSISGIFLMVFRKLIG